MAELELNPREAYGQLYFLDNTIESISPEIPIQIGFVTDTGSLILNRDVSLAREKTMTLSGSFLVSGSTTQLGNNTLAGNTLLSGSIGIVGNSTLSGSFLVSGSTTQIGNNTLLGNTILDGTIQIIGASTLTGSFLVSGSTTQLGNNTLQGNTLLDGTIGIVGNSTLSGSFLVSGSTTQIGNNVQIGNNTLDGNTKLSGSVQITGSMNVLGDINILSGSAFYHWGNKLFNYGQFSDTRTQSGSANIAYPMLLNTTDLSYGVYLQSGSQIVVENMGLYNIQFSAQLEQTSNGASTISIWFRKNGVNIPNSNTEVTIEKVVGGGKLFAAWNYLTQLNANDYIEIVWSSDTNNTTIHYHPTQTNPDRPVTPSVIVTMTQIA